MAADAPRRTPIWSSSRRNCAHRRRYFPVRVSYLELAEPNIETGGAQCVEDGAAGVILVPYFLSPGVHVVEDLVEARDKLNERFPQVRFVLAGTAGPAPAACGCGGTACEGDRDSFVTSLIRTNAFARAALVW